MENVSDMVLSDDVPDNPPADCKNSSRCYAPFTVQSLAESAFARDDTEDTKKQKQYIW